MSNIRKNKTVKVKTKTGNEYSYRYTDLASINTYLENNKIKYYQFVDRVGDDDYIMTVIIENEIEKPPRRGCKLINASTTSNGNEAQDYGAIITYCRRYSLLMALGLATEDNDAQNFNKKSTVKTNTGDPIVDEIADGWDKVFAEDELQKDIALSPIQKAIKSEIISEKDMLTYFKIKSIKDMKYKQIEEAKTIIKKREEKLKKENEEVF